MRKRLRQGAATIAVAAALLGPSAAAQTPTPTGTPGASPTPTPRPGDTSRLTAAAAILVNPSDDSQVIYERAPKARRAPASLTKVVTALVVRDEYDLDEVVNITPLVLQTEGSDLSLEPGMKATVRDLMYALLLKSANDAGMALAGHHPGGYEFFVQLMNQKARSLGAYDSQFRNPHGLDMDGHYSSARDMAIFGREVLKDPVLADMVRTKRHSMPWPKDGGRRVFVSHNRLLLRDPEVIGVKTGFTARAGYSLIAARRSAAGTLLTVVMGSNDHYADTVTLFEHAKEKALRSASGGGSVEAVGALPAPPEPPIDPLVDRAVSDTIDPRDDVRWSVLMIALAGASVLSLLWSRRTARTGDDAVQVWLARIANDSR